jgi:hypothetical protein
VSSRLPGSYTIRQFGAFGYYRVRVDRFSLADDVAEGFDTESLLLTVLGSVVVSGACLLEWGLTARRSGRGDEMTSP